MSMQEQLTKSALARVIEKGNHTILNSVMLSPERTSVESNVVHDNLTGRNGELTVIHDTVGSDDTDVPDEIRFERKVIEYSHVHFTVNDESEPLTINVLGEVSEAKIIDALNADHGFTLRAGDIKPITRAGAAVLTFTPECLLYSGSMNVVITLTPEPPTP